MPNFVDRVSEEEVDRLIEEAGLPENHFNLIPSKKLKEVSASNSKEHLQSKGFFADTEDSFK